MILPKRCPDVFARIMHLCGFRAHIQKIKARNSGLTWDHVLRLDKRCCPHSHNRGVCVESDALVTVASKEAHRNSHYHQRAQQLLDGYGEQKLSLAESSPVLLIPQSRLVLTGPPHSLPVSRLLGEEF